MSAITLPVVSIQATLKYRDVELSTEEYKVYAKASANLKEIDRLLNELVGQIPVTQTITGQDQNGRNGYVFCRLDYIGRHVISIKRPTRDNFYWTIGVQSENDDLNTPIYKYYNMGTNGNIDDIREALECTKHLFPEVSRKRAKPRLSV